MYKLVAIDLDGTMLNQYGMVTEMTKNAIRKTIEKGIVPPTINLINLDPEAADLDYVANKSKQKDVKTALSNSFGFGGHNAVLMFEKY